METFKIRTHVGGDGILKLELPVHTINTDLEVLVVMQPMEAEEELDEMGYPVGYFDETYGSLRDTPIQRWDQGEYEEREPLE